MCISLAKRLQTRWCAFGSNCNASFIALSYSPDTFYQHTWLPLLVTSRTPIQAKINKLEHRINELFNNAFGGGLDPNKISAHLIPTTANTFDLGSSDRPWRDVHLSGATLVIGGTELAAGELTVLDNITAGTVSASKAVIADSSKDITGFRNVNAVSYSINGTAIASTLEGIRPLMIEVQALVSTAVYGTPQRSTTGYNLKRLNMILAVLEKRAGFKLGAKDVFLNTTGGINVDDPAIDLAVVAAILSSNQDVAINPNVCFAAEVGLAGEIRPVSKIDQRILEAEKLGYKTFVTSKYNKISSNKHGIKLILVGKIEEAFASLFA